MTLHHSTALHQLAHSTRGRKSRECYRDVMRRYAWPTSKRSGAVPLFREPDNCR